MTQRFVWLLAGLSVLNAGCAHQMYGTWKTVKIEPASAAARYQVASITLNQDGTYCAVATEDGQDKKSTGKWTYDGMKLRLTTTEGKSREYDASVLWGKEMFVSHAGHGGQKVTVKMEKVACEGKCAPGTCSKCDKRPCSVAK